MTTSKTNLIAAMGWDEFAARLEAAARQSGRTAGHRELEEYFGAAELQMLLRLGARAVREGRQRAERPVVVFLPGIMGTHLSVVRRGTREETVWVDYLGLVAGGIGLLRLSDDGRREADPAVQVRCTTIDKRAYARLILRLCARWDVQPFAYDWRKDLALAADELAERIRTQYRGRPVHLLAHSMGGLVARAFIRRHRRVWETMEHGGAGGRLVMLGTPNYGSFDAVRVFAGQQPLLRLLAAVDLKHSLRELQEIVAGFPALYQVLPDPERAGAGGEALYTAAAWGDRPVSLRHLKRARAFHAALAAPGEDDTARMWNILGNNRETLAGLRVCGHGRFDYTTTPAGDGRVPHSLGLIEGVPAYFADLGHGELPRSLRVIDAADQILEKGATKALDAAPSTGPRRPASRAARGAGQTAPAPPGDPRATEQALLEAALGVTFDQPAGVRSSRRRARQRQRLVIEVAAQDITRVRVPVVAVGHYQGVAPANALGALDRSIGGWLAHAAKNSILSGELGRLSYIPAAGKLIAAAGVLVAGMGLEGRFSSADLRYLMQSIAAAVAAWKLGSFATVLIGAGEGNIPLEQALRSMMEGICDALERLPAGQTLKKIVLAEIDRERAGRMTRLLEEMRGGFAERGVRLEVRGGARGGTGAARTALARRPAARGTEAFGPRLTVTRENDTLRFAALTRQSVVPAREVEVQEFYLHGIAEKLMRAETVEEQHRLGRLLGTYLLPADLCARLGDGGPLTVVVDRTTAAIPWEMAAAPGSGRARFFGPDLRMARQFQTLLAPAPAVVPPPDGRLRVLVVADPAPGDLHLPGAETEGREMVRLFEALRRAAGLDLHLEARIGPEECDPVEILALLLDGEYGIVHFAGHGVFDEARPNHSGWVFGREDDGRLRTLSATEIFRARRAPRLVFANACFSAAAGRRPTAFEQNRKLAGMAEAFFERGVANYIGSGWAVGDGPAVEFAREFYAQALAGVPARRLRSAAGAAGAKSLGEALGAARSLILDQGPTWGAYQHYGDPMAKLLAGR